MSIATYSELQTAVGSWLHNASLSNIADFITLGEATLNRRLRAREMETAATVTTSTTNRYASLPTGFLELVAFLDDEGVPLKERTSEELEAMAYQASADRPEYYKITARIEFERKDSSAHNYTIWYRKKLDIATDLTNAVLTKWPDAYLYSSLLAGAAWVRETSMLPLWKMALDEIILDANAQSSRSLATLGTDLMMRETSNILRG